MTAILCICLFVPLLVSFCFGLFRTLYGMDVSVIWKSLIISTRKCFLLFKPQNHEKFLDLSLKFNYL